MGLLGGYGPGDKRYRIRHKNVTLMELDDFSYDVSTPRSPSGAGLGHLRNRRHVTTGAAEGTWSLTRSQLSKEEYGEMFQRLLTGAAGLITEKVTLGSDTHTLGEIPAAVLEVRLVDSGVLLERNRDYVVNFSTGVITFEATTPEDAIVSYVTEERDWFGPNLVPGGQFASNITGVWAGVGTGTVVRDADNAYLGSYGLAVTVTTTADGAAYQIPVFVKPGRTYKISFRAKGTDADTLQVDVEMNEADVTATELDDTSDGVLSAEWKLHEFTVEATHAKITQITITNTTATPADFYIDDFKVCEYQPAFDLMDAGHNKAFTFDVDIFRVYDGAIIATLGDCAVYDTGISSGDKYSESVSGQFLHYYPEGEPIDDLS